MDDDRNACLEAVLEGYRVKYDSGDKSALLDAVECCAMYQLVMPNGLLIGLQTHTASGKTLQQRPLMKHSRLKEKTLLKRKNG